MLLFSFSLFRVDSIQFNNSFDVARCDSAVKQLYRDNSEVIEPNSIQVHCVSGINVAISIDFFVS